MKCSLFFYFAGLLLVLTSVPALSAAKVDYTGHMVIRVIPETKEQLEFLRDWQSTSSIDIWSLPSKPFHPADILVSPQSYYHVARTLADMKMTEQNIFITDLGRLEKLERESIELRRIVHSRNGNGKAFDLENYNTYEEILDYLNGLVNTSSIVSTRVGGITEEERDIVQLTVGSGVGENKPVIFFDCDIHAREWISTATCLWIINQLVSGYDKNDLEIIALIDSYDWKFVPVTNPDGYVYSWTDDRMWRKNRAVNKGSPCLGVDANRNFPGGFGGEGSSDLACSLTYHGASPFSEKESTALKELIALDKPRVKSAISVHSYSQYWMSPYGYTIDKPADYEEMFRAMKVGVEALTETYGTEYLYGNSAETIYFASGVTVDYYYDVEKVLYAYTIELRDTGTYGFILPADQIVPTATETWNGIKAMVKVFQ